MSKKPALLSVLAALLLISGCSTAATANRMPYPCIKTCTEPSSEAENTSQNTQNSDTASKTENSKTESKQESSKKESKNENSKTSSKSDENEYYLRGSIFDVNMRCLMSSVTEKGKTPYRKLEPKYISLSNILSDQSEGLDTVFENILRTANPTRNEKSQELVGKSVQLTLNAEMSQKIYNRMQKEKVIGSVVVMRSDGSIAAMVSSPSYDVNQLQSDTNYSKTLGSSGAFINRTLSAAAPGSTFKIISEIIADLHNIDKMEDEGRINIQSTYLQNHDWEDEKESYPMQTDRLDAFIRSSNVYFAKVFDKVGEKDVKNDLQKYFLLSDSTKINCDFGVLHNTLNIENRDNLCRSAFGQGNVRLSPIYLAAVTREGIYGNMVEPFVLRSIVDTNNKTSIQEGSHPYKEIASLPDKCKANIKQCLKVSGTLRKVNLPNEYTLYSKTGTANVGDSLYLYITGGVVHKNDQTVKKTLYTDGYKNFSKQGGYIITMQIQNPRDFHFEFASDADYIYNDIINIVLKESE